MSYQFKEIVDKLDAEIQSGDALHSEDNKKLLEESLSSWSRVLEDITNSTWSPYKLPKYGDVFAIDKFIDYVREHTFIDDDGCGDLVKKEGDRWFDIPATVYCDVTFLQKQKAKGVTHIVWFNK